MSGNRAEPLASFGQRVRDLDEQRGRASAVVAALAGMPLERFEGIEAGTVEADVLDVYVLAQVLAVEPRSFFEEATTDTGPSR